MPADSSCREYCKRLNGVIDNGGVRMSNQNAGGKSKYESPVLVPLGEMAKGSGVCATGSSVVPVVACSPGNADAADCSGGGTDAGAGATSCTAGPTATNNCTAGLSAQMACTAGTAARNECTGGTSAILACTDAGVAAINACTAGGHVGT